MDSNKSSKSELIRQLLATGCLKFGQFTLKSGALSPYYVDLREATMSPSLFKEVLNGVVGQLEKILTSRGNLDQIAVVGVPYGVVPLAAVAAHECKLPYYPVRKEVKEYGNKTDLARFEDWQFILIEDVMSTGSSIVETIKKLDGKRVTDVIAVVNREAGGELNLKASYPHIKLHSILSASQLLAAKNDDV